MPTFRCCFYVVDDAAIVVDVIINIDVFDALMFYVYRYTWPDAAFSMLTPPCHDAMPAACRRCRCLSRFHYRRQLQALRYARYIISPRCHAFSRAACCRRCAFFFFSPLDISIRCCFMAPTDERYAMILIDVVAIAAVCDYFHSFALLLRHAVMLLRQHIDDWFFTLMMPPLRYEPRCFFFMLST